MRYLALLILSAVSTWVVAANPTQDTLRLQAVSDSAVAETEPIFVIQPDHPIAVMLDSLINEPYLDYFSTSYDTLSLNSYGYGGDSVPLIADSIMAERLAILDAQTPFNLTFNSKTSAFINLYAVKKRGLTSKMLGLADTYFPVIEPILDQYDLPLEFKYLAVVESALRPTARSRAGACGMWQFMYATGKMYGLQVTSYYDERQDVIKSTHAACHYFMDLYKIYGNWELVMAAYNCGPGNVNKAIRRSGGKKDYWEIYRYLPRETRGYVPAFIAVNYIMNNASLHNIYPVQPQFQFTEIDTVHIKEPMDYDVLSATLDISMEDIATLNPMYRRDRIVEDRHGNRVLVLPKDKVGLYITNEDSIYAFAQKDIEIPTKEKEVTQEERMVHVVRSGEYLGGIASKYNVPLSRLKDWNGLYSSRIYPGQRLVVYVPDNQSYNRPQPKAAPTKTNGDVEYYTIQRGDTLWDIAKARGISVNELKRLNSHLNFNRLKPGSRIVVGNAG